MNYIYKIIGVFPLSIFTFFENKKAFSKIFEIVLFKYFSYFFQKVSCQIAKEKIQPRIFILCNSFPLWESSIGSHLRATLNIAKIYYDKGYKINYIVSNHPYKSKYNNNGVIFKSNFNINKNRLEEKLKLDIFNISGMKDIKVDVLTNYEDSFRLKQYCSYILEFFNKLDLNNADIIFFVGGKLQSTILNILLTKINLKKIYITGGRTERIKNINNFTYFIAPENPKYIDLKEHSTFINKIYLFEPLYLETINSISLKMQELDIIEQLKYNGITKLLVYVKQNAASSIDLEFSNIINKNLNDKSTGILVIGDSKENIKNKLNKHNNKVFTLSFCNHLYTLFKQLNVQFTTVFIMPKLNGNGGTIMIAGLSGMPVVLYKGNDSEGIYIPKKYCVDNLEKYEENLNFFLNDDNSRKIFIKDMEIFKEEKKEEAKKLYLGFLEK